MAFAQQEEDMKYKVGAQGFFSNGVGVFKVRDLDKAPFLTRRMLRLIENKADRFRETIEIYEYDSRGRLQNTTVRKPKSNLPQWIPDAPRRDRKQNKKAKGQQTKRR